MHTTRSRPIDHVREVVAHPLVVLLFAAGALVAGVAFRASAILWLAVAVLAGYSLSGSV
jgi:hypothetical protein